VKMVRKGILGVYTLVYKNDKNYLEIY
jgi:hypothetical protein